tara:strand:+ start:1623 stop:2465 length:843 start_codon:yes stop_codon:yes gene_type:complete
MEKIEPKVEKSRQYKYTCKVCDYNTCKKTDYEKHLRTLKHKSNLFEPEKSTIFVCNTCGKEFKSKSGIWSHNKRCKIDLKERTNCSLESLSNKELVVMMGEAMEQIKKQSQQIDELIPKVGNNNNNNTQFNLNIFLNEECKDAVDWTEFVNSIELELTHLNILKDSNMTTSITMAMRDKINELGVNKRPIHCYDAKRRKLCIKNNKDWEKEDEKINELLDKGDKNLKHKYIALIEDAHKEFESDENKIEEYMELQQKLYQDVDKKKTITNLMKDINIPKI